MDHICLYSLLWYNNSFRNDVLCFVDLVKNAFHAESNETRKTYSETKPERMNGMYPYSGTSIRHSWVEIVRVEMCTIISRVHIQHCELWTAILRMLRQSQLSSSWFGIYELEALQSVIYLKCTFFLFYLTKLI